MRHKPPIALQALLAGFAFIGLLAAGTVAIALTKPSSFVFFLAFSAWLLLCFAGLMEFAIRLVIRNPSSKLHALSDHERKLRIRAIRVEPLLWLGGALAIFLVANLTIGSHP